MKTKPNTPTKLPNISIANYQELAMGTCLKKCKNIRYFHFGIKSELHELLGKVEGLRAKNIRGDEITKEKIDGIKDEIGDLFWFIALGCTIFAKKDAKNAFKRIYEKTIADVSKETIITHTYCKDLDEYGSQTINTCILYMSNAKRIALELGIKPYDCLVRNIKKLYDRKERGVIKGNGDKR